MLVVGSWTLPLPGSPLEKLEFRPELRKTRTLANSTYLSEVEGEGGDRTSPAPPFLMVVIVLSSFGFPSIFEIRVSDFALVYCPHPIAKLALSRRLRWQ